MPHLTVCAANPERIKATTRLVLRSLSLICTEAVVLLATLVKFKSVIACCFTRLDCPAVTALLYTALWWQPYPQIPLPANEITICMWCTRDAYLP